MPGRSTDDQERGILPEPHGRGGEPVPMNYATNTTMVPTSLDDEVELDSPGFVSRELAAFSARGFQRRNRWAV